MEDNNALFREIKKISVLYGNIAADMGLSESAFWVLYVLCTSTCPCSQQCIASKLSIPKQTVNSAVQVLCQNGYIYLEYAPNTVRTKLIKLTETGTEFIQKNIYPLLQVEKRVLYKMGPQGGRPCEEFLRNYIVFMQEEIKQRYN